MTGDETAAERLRGLRERMDTLEAELEGCRGEFERLLLDNGADFRGSHIVRHASGEYVFMRVESQTRRDGGRSVSLRGPALTLCDNPLTLRKGDDGIDVGSYDEDGEITVSASSLVDAPEEAVMRITPDEMRDVIRYFARTLRETLL